jgi:hypothetical protein
MLRVAMTAGLGLLLAGSVSPARAAGLQGETLKAHVPFAFEVHGVTMPSGDYVIRETDNIDRNLLEIRSADGREAAFFFVVDSGPMTSKTRHARLVFDRLGQSRFLRSVRLEDGDRERLPVSPDEVLAARSDAGLPPASPRL